MASTGAAIVVFCTSPEQAADFEDLGAEYLVDANEPARELAAAVRAAYRHRVGQTIH
jgi:D-arabinose 1-dehydrogenase-like Zn-dependent alcohol dehydrogenase